ncbi:ERI1 exoribonuclease 2 isoform X2 [Carassius auratus]|uniref:ERI1 exoribonuclease 2 isoform X2 n=1 Tax=Carassius auratus TaxID=7957 RepID=A0A6P6J0Y4_CARAU|nr:ERI1 exoribonuclease 2 isoform X2 [Carassius auratus]
MSTKSLAKELGLIRKRSHSSGAHQRPSVRKQRFSFLIIIDFESTCWREKSSRGQEIIEFPAVLLNVSNGEVESEFHSYVQPQEHPVLSGFCTELTGITQDQVDSAPPLHICLSRFTRWLHALQQERGVVFEMDSTGPAPSGHPCAFVTWSGLVDARNTALLACRMMTDGCLLTLTKSLRGALVKCRASRGSVSGERPSALCEQQTSVCRSLVSPRTLLSSTNTPDQSRPLASLSTLAGLSDTTYDPDTADACWRDGVLLTEGEEPGSYDDVVVGAEPEETDPAGASESTSDHHRPVRPASSSSSRPLPHTDPYAPLSRFLGRSGASFSVYTDPPGRVSRVTSPLCGCGRRARRLTVGNGGPNHGRVFYCCPVRRQSCGAPQKGCDFFKWESAVIQSSRQKQIRAPQTCRSRPLR